MGQYRKENITPFNEYLRSSIWCAFKNNKYQKKNSIEPYIGCSFEELKKHIENQFTKGMTWENKKEWHTDHKVPFSSVETLDEVKKLCHYTNMQPLWIKDHIEKSRYEKTRYPKEASFSVLRSSDCADVTSLETTNARIGTGSPARLSAI